MAQTWGAVLYSYTELARLLGNRTRALLLFERQDFDPELFLEDYLANASDKAIENARQDLGALLAACSTQVRCQHC